MCPSRVLDKSFVFYSFSKVDLDFVELKVSHATQDYSRPTTLPLLPTKMLARLAARPLLLFLLLQGKYPTVLCG